MYALGFFDEFVEKGEAVGEFGRPFCVFGYAGVDELLDEAVLVARVNTETGAVLVGGFCVRERGVRVTLTRIAAMRGAMMWW
mgnify:CR=1 FL=1